MRRWMVVVVACAWLGGIMVPGGAAAQEPSVPPKASEAKAKGKKMGPPVDPAKRAKAVRDLCETLGIGKGSVVADVGCGKGQDTMVFAEVVGPTGKVFAQEIGQDMLDAVAAKATERGWTHVATALGATDDPRLPDATMDLISMHHVFHHFAKPSSMLANFWKDLRPGGRLVIIDRERGPQREWPDMLGREKKHSWTGETTVVRLAREAGFLFEDAPDDIWPDRKSFVLVFKKPEGVGTPSVDPDLPEALDGAKVVTALPPIGVKTPVVLFVGLDRGRAMLPALREKLGTEARVFDVVLEEWRTFDGELPAGASGGIVRTANGDLPELEERSLDAVVFADSFSRLWDPAPLLRRLRAALKPGALVAILDREGPEGESRPLAGHRRRIAPARVNADLEAAGFRLAETLSPPAGDRFLLVFLALAGGRASGDTVTVSPTPSSAVVLNPGKGWALYGDAPAHDNRLLAVSNLGYRRFEWADLEPSEGSFDWAPVESFLAGWDKLGKQAAFGVMCLSSHTRRPDGYSTPKWVFDAGSPRRIVELKEIKQQTTGTPGVKVVPTFNDPVFLEKLSTFLKAMGRRFDGERRIAFIDVRSYGNWGEGHMHPFGGEPITSEEFRHHIELHLKAFKATRLCVSCENQRSPHVSVYDWAVKEKGCAARRDGICGNSDGSETLRAFGIAPAVFELFGPYEMLKEQGWWHGRDRENRKGYGHRLEDCVEIGKPSYIDLSRGGKSGLELLTAEPGLVNRLANRMGYHFLIEEVSYPGAFARSRPTTAAFRWRNAGVAPIYVPCHVAIGLLDASDRVRASCWPPEAKPKNWAPDQTVSETLTLRFPDAPPGSYQLSVGLFENRAAENPSIRLGIEGKTARGWHVLGPVQVKP